MEGLQLPAPFHEGGGEPVEELGVAGALAEPAEVARRGHEPAAEMSQPETVDEHPGDERMTAPRQPPCIGEAPSA